ncbi:MAG: pentapeptide repeat-containing protein [Planctomycetales bacterium]
MPNISAIIVPRIAPVKPRVILSETGDAAPLENLIGDLLRSGDRGSIEILGGDGSGKTTALRHLAALVPPDPGRLLYLDDALAPSVRTWSRDRLVVYSSDRTIPGQPLVSRPLVSCVMTPWEQDDLIEYLVATQPGQAASVIKRALAAKNWSVLGGNPQLCRLVLDQLVQDPKIRRLASALRGALRRATEGQSTAVLRACAYESLICGALRDGFNMPEHAVVELDVAERRSLERQGVLKLMRHDVVQLCFAVDYVEQELRNRPSPECLGYQMPGELIRAVGARIASDSGLIRKTRELVEGDDLKFHPVCAGILHATNTGWMPNLECLPTLIGAHLPNAKWFGSDLKDADLRYVNLSGAELSTAVMDGVKADHATFRNAKMQGVWMLQTEASHADFSQADLSDARVYKTEFSNADFRGAKLDNARLKHTIWHETDLRGASMRNVDLSGACLIGSELEHADLTEAIMLDADLSGVDLRKTKLITAALARAELSHCNLSRLFLPRAYFRDACLTNADLTGLQAPGADFRRANLQGAKLALIDWERADLRDADLTRSCFQLPGSRSGLVFSPYPCEGSRTGFYTDDYDDHYFKRPEEIRMANLRGADLRGAKLDQTDFYLVDLRDARFSEEQREHFQKCRAILDPV